MSNLYTGSRNVLSKKETELAIYKWELLRRNSDYRKFYCKYKDLFYDQDARNSLSDEGKRLLEMARQKFGIQYLLNPYGSKTTVNIIKKIVLPVFIDHSFCYIGMVIV